MGGCGVFVLRVYNLFCFSFFLVRFLSRVDGRKDEGLRRVEMVCKIIVVRNVESL